MNNTKDLFEVLCEKAGCEYMSDMKFKLHREEVCKAASGLKKEDFKLEQWTELVSYYLGEPVVFSTYDDVEAFFQDK